MIIVTYKQWVDGTRFCSGYYGECSEIFNTEEDLKKEIENSNKTEKRMIVTGIWCV